jgi:hypothetical protein
MRAQISPPPFPFAHLLLGQLEKTVPESTCSSLSASLVMRDASASTWDRAPMGEIMEAKCRYATSSNMMTRKGAEPEPKNGARELSPNLRMAQELAALCRTPTK